ncbi:MAG TPA: DUF4232 domain-containing protein [Streptosporangiaceae bacterium]|nr:DUF4232 domain-containing protein [Streptosporangiaceae bacterium]
MTLGARAAGARLVVAGTALACLTVLAGGCGTAAPSASSAGSAPTVSPSGSADPAAPAASSSSPAGVSTPAPVRTLTAPPAYGATNGAYPCPASWVTVTLGASQVTKAITYQVIDFTNHGPRLCSFGGLPGVSLAGGTPLAQIGLAAPVSVGGFTPRAFSVNPGGEGNSLLQISNASNYARATCDPVHASYLVIAVPDDIGFVKLAYSTTACAKPIQILSVSPISRGSGS